MRRRTRTLLVAFGIGAIICSCSLVGILLAILASDPSRPAPAEQESPGPLEVKIARIYLHNLMAVRFGGEVTPTLDTTPVLYVHVRVKNISATQKVDFVSWGQEGSDVALIDDVKNTYSPVRIPRGAQSIWSPYLGYPFAGKALNPGDACTDFAVFQRPVKQATTLYLSLPRSHYGERKHHVFTIPTNVIEGF